MRIAVPPLDPAALKGHDPAARIIDLAGQTMGTGWSMRMAAPQGFDSLALQATVEQRLAGLVAEMSHWESGSLLCRFNRAAAGSWLSLPPDFAAVMEAALRTAETSDGAFDPSLGALVDLWGFGPPGPQPSPSAQAIAEAAARCGWRRLAFDPAGRRLLQPGGLSLDLSGIAKGYAVDAISVLLRASGVRHALIEIGGELTGLGIKPDGEPWWVDLEQFAAPGIAPFRIALHQIAVATSGDYVRGRHTINPFSGHPIDPEIASVSVLHSSAMIADAWASALSVLGAERGIHLAEQEELPVRFVLRTPDGFSEKISPALEAMLAD